MNPWTGPNGKVFDLDDAADGAAAFYLVCGLQHSVKPVPKPPVVPSMVRIHRRVAGDWPIGHLAVVMPGVYTCQSNPYGAVSVKAGNGTMLGLKPAEYEPVAWWLNKTEVSDASSL